MSLARRFVASRRLHNANALFIAGLGDHQSDKLSEENLDARADSGVESNGRSPTVSPTADSAAGATAASGSLDDDVVSQRMGGEDEVATNEGGEVLTTKADNEKAEYVNLIPGSSSGGSPAGPTPAGDGTPTASPAKEAQESSDKVSCRIFRFFALAAALHSLFWH